LDAHRTENHEVPVFPVNDLLYTAQTPSFPVYLGRIGIDRQQRESIDKNGGTPPPHYFQ